MHPRFVQLGLLLISIAVTVSVTSPAFACPEVAALSIFSSFAKAFVGATKAGVPATPAVTGRQNFAGISEYAGFCEKPNQNALRGQSVDTYHLVVREDSAASFDRYQKNHPGQPWRRYDGQPLNVTDFVAIDVIARTLMGEMGNINSCGKPYMAGAARIIMNRGIQLLNNPERYAKVFGSNKRCTDFSQCMANAALMRKQFSLWNHLPYDRHVAEAHKHSKNKAIHNKGVREVAMDDSQESVTDTALCPKGSPTPARMQAWHNAVELATIAVTAPWQMKEITPDIHAMWYTSGMPMCGGTHVPDGHAYGHSLNKDSCLEMWQDNGNCNRGGKKSKAVARTHSKPDKKKGKK